MDAFGHFLIALNSLSDETNVPHSFEYMVKCMASLSGLCEEM